MHDEAYHVGSPGKKTTHTRLPDSSYPNTVVVLATKKSFVTTLCVCVMLAMAVQPNLNVSLKPLAFPSQKIKPLLEKASIFANPISKTTTLSNLKLSSHCHTHTYTPTTKLVKPIWASATAEATVAEEHTVSDGDFTSQSPPDKEVSLSLSLSLSLCVCLCG